MEIKEYNESNLLQKFLMLFIKEEIKVLSKIEQKAILMIYKDLGKTKFIIRKLHIH